MTYSEKLRDPRWQRLRLRVMERDGFACRDCGSGAKTLHVHHCFYDKGEPWKTDARFLLTLCEECHESRGELESDARRALGMICAKMANASDDLQLREFVKSLCQATEIEFPIVVDEGELIDAWRRANP